MSHPGAPLPLHFWIFPNLHPLKSLLYFSAYLKSAKMSPLSLEILSYFILFGWMPFLRSPSIIASTALPHDVIFAYLSVFLSNYCVLFIFSVLFTIFSLRLNSVPGLLVLLNYLLNNVWNSQFKQQSPVWKIIR